MQLVKTKIGPSKTHGIGLFANQFIPKGTPTWEYVEWFDASFTEEDLEKMSDHARYVFLWYAYYDKPSKKYVLCADDQRFINHSNHPDKINIKSTPDKDIACKDINIGEELLCNYNEFDDTYFDRVKLRQDKLN